MLQPAAKELDIRRTHQQGRRSEFGTNGGPRAPIAARPIRLHHAVMPRTTPPFDLTGEELACDDGPYWERRKYSPIEVFISARHWIAGGRSGQSPTSYQRTWLTK